MTITLGSYELLFGYWLFGALSFATACVFAHWLRKPLRTLVAPWLHSAPPAQQPIDPPKLPRFLVGSWIAMEEIWGELFSPSRAQDLLWFLVALPIGVLDFVVNLFAVRVAFAGTELAGIAAVGLYLSLVFVAVRPDDERERCRRVALPVVFGGLVLVATGLGGYSTYVVGIAQRLPPSALIGATFLGAALRMFVSLAAAWAGAKCLRGGFLSQVLVFVIGALLLLPLTLVVGAGVLGWLVVRLTYRWLVCAPRLVPPLRFLYMVMAEIGALLVLAPVRRRAPRPAVHVNAPADRQFVADSVSVSGKCPTGDTIQVLLDKDGVRYLLGAVSVTDGRFEAELPLNGHQAMAYGRCLLVVTDGDSTARVPVFVKPLDIPADPAKSTDQRLAHSKEVPHMSRMCCFEHPARAALLLLAAVPLLACGCKDPVPRTSVAVVCVVDLTGWWDNYGEAAQEWLNDRLLPWLRGGDTLGIATIGNRVGDDRAVGWLEKLRGEGLYDQLFLSDRAAAAEFIDKLAPAAEPQPGTAVWETVDQAASTLSAMEEDAHKVIFFLSDLQPDAGASLQPRDHPETPFPDGTKGVVLFLARRGVPESEYGQTKNDITAKLAAVNVSLAVPPLAPAESAQFDPNRVIKRSDSLF